MRYGLVLHNFFKILFFFHPRFVFDGRQIHDDETPELLQMKQDDIIEVYQEHKTPYYKKNGQKFWFQWGKEIDLKESKIQLEKNELRMFTRREERIRQGILYYLSYLKIENELIYF